MHRKTRTGATHERIGGTPILVVGGRTTGLTMACELARHGAPVRIVDKSPGIDPHCRATVIHSRSLEVFQDLGIVDEVLAKGAKVLGMSLYANGRRFMHARYHGVDSPFPWGVALPQCQTEGILEELLKRLGVAVERQTELVAMAQHLDGVRVTLRHADSREEVVDTPWLVGCDGAHSTVRHLNQEQFPGEADPHQYVLADAVVDAPIDHNEGHGFFTDDGVLYMFTLPEGRTLIAANLPEHHDAATETPTLTEIQALVTQRGPAGARVSDPRWLTYFRINYRLTPHYRHERTFLAGDAAHIHSLVGGQGMSTGIQDAYNLAWKLALVARGRAPESLLDSYETERRQVAEDVVKTTKIATEGGEVFAHLSAEDREKLCARMIVPESERLRMARHSEEIDLDYRKSPICVEHGERFAAGPHAGSQALDAGGLQVDGQTMTLFELLRGPQHTLLLFVGSTREQPSTDGLVDLAASVVRAHGDLMKVCFVATESGTKLAALAPQARIVRDPQQTLHRRYGAETECLYLIRPDGYVAYRSRPATTQSFREYLDGVF